MEHVTLNSTSTWKPQLMFTFLHCTTHWKRVHRNGLMNQLHETEHAQLSMLNRAAQPHQAISASCHDERCHSTPASATSTRFSGLLKRFSAIVARLSPSILPASKKGLS
eukprot:GHRQ01025694.1.p1 GENE.GHRQ01025694.1~~GHRQ01025694.1.p1  ORF type:complete len:109 (+),score=9.08 GHRQ01025694.1:292-618(+)